PPALVDSRWMVSLMLVLPFNPADTGSAPRSTPTTITATTPRTGTRTAANLLHRVRPAAAAGLLTRGVSSGAWRRRHSRSMNLTPPPLTISHDLSMPRTSLIGMSSAGVEGCPATGHPACYCRRREHSRPGRLPDPRAPPTPQRRPGRRVRPDDRPGLVGGHHDRG